MIKVSHFQNTKLKNKILTLKTALSPRVPKSKRKTYKQVAQNKKRQSRDTILLSALK